MSGRPKKVKDGVIFNLIIERKKRDALTKYAVSVDKTKADIVRALIDNQLSNQTQEEQGPSDVQQSFNVAVTKGMSKSKECHMSLTLIRNQYLECKRIFNLSVTSSINDVLSDIGSTTQLNENLDIIINYDKNRTYVATPLMTIDIRLNRPIIQLISVNDYGVEIPLILGATAEQLDLYQRLSESLCELAKSAGNYNPT